MIMLILFLQRGLNIATFCKDFNARTANYIEGVPLPCRILVKSDRSYELIIHNPPTSFFLKQAAGIQRGAMHSGKFVGFISQEFTFILVLALISCILNVSLNKKMLCLMPQLYYMVVLKATSL